MSSKSLLILAGEKSGEEHCLSFFDNLKKDLEGWSFFGVGGDQLQRKGVQLLYHLKDFSTFGFTEVIMKFPFYVKAFYSIIKAVEEKNCKNAILIDFQGLNLRLAQKLKKRGVNVFYYVAPQAWAWKSKRAIKLKRSVHTLFTILPFEKKWFLARGVQNVISVPHPLINLYRDTYGKPKKEVEEKVLLLLPGSRNFEVEYLLPVFIGVATKLNKRFDFKLAIVRSPNVDEILYRPYIDYIDFDYTSEQLSDALEGATWSLAASGTVTLACALFCVPTVVSYKASLLNYWVFENFINYRGAISLGNIVHGKKIFPEFIQDRVSVYNLTRSLENWMIDESKTDKLRSELLSTKDLLKGDRVDFSTYIAKSVQR